MESSAVSMPSSATILKENRFRERPKFKCWRPSQPSALNPVDQDDPIPGNYFYEEFDAIARVVHFQDYLQIARDGKMNSIPLSEDTPSIMTSFEGLKGLWFGPSSSKDTFHNWYGNVSFKLNSDFLDLARQNYNLDFVEVVEYNTNCASRILISKKQPEFPYDPSIFGGPWLRDEEGHKYLKEIKTYGNENICSATKPHVLEFFLDIETLPLHNFKDIIAVNHSDANNTEHIYHKCKKFRSGGRQWQECPSPWTAVQTEAMMQQF